MGDLLVPLLYDGIGIGIGIGTGDRHRDRLKLPSLAVDDRPARSLARWEAVL
jgi:hypothetical protein